MRALAEADDVVKQARLGYRVLVGGGSLRRPQQLVACVAETAPVAAADQGRARSTTIGSRR